MFHRLVFESSATLFTIVAFVTAASIYVTFAWHALRMKRDSVAHFENLPFDTATPACTGEQTGRALDATSPEQRRQPAPAQLQS